MPIQTEDQVHRGLAPYCIAQVLANAAEGKLDEAFAFAGSNVCRCNEIISVKELIQKIMQEYADAK